MPVGVRSISLASMSASAATSAALASDANRLRAGAPDSGTVSIRVFQASQCGHLPSQRGLVPPHSVQT